ncbi:MAG: hypothetical protein NUV68_02055 [Caldiserica bacterium]|jgi:hypothetical protein|nr:hypothetical protein [Caldisericota bacterium]MDH7562141.1 hypothetical protein [Caldisericota bacterium]
MLEIDDSGWGCPIGGVLIGALRRETEEFLTGIIPVSFFQEEFKKGSYLLKARSLAKNLMGRLKVRAREQIVVCQGPLFREFRAFLFEKGYNFQVRTIGDPLQSLLEKSFAQYLNSLGVPQEVLAQGAAHPSRMFRGLLRWVAEDYEQRIRLCKTGWSSWEKWEELIAQEMKSIQEEADFT